jgi:hypothetical protein
LLSNARSLASALARISMCNVNSAWLRLLAPLSACGAVLRAWSPRKNCRSASSSLATGTLVRPRT